MRFKIIMENNDFLAIPAKMADYFIKIATGEQLKVLIFIARHQNSDLSLQQIAAETSLSEQDVADALEFLKCINIISDPIFSDDTVTDTFIDKSENTTNSPVTSESFAETIKRDFSFHRNFSAKENELVKSWFIKGISIDLALYAYAEAILRIGSPNLTYIDKILSSWLTDKKTSVEAVADSETDEKKKKKSEIISKSRSLSKQINTPR